MTFLTLTEYNWEDKVKVGNPVRLQVIDNPEVNRDLTKKKVQSYNAGGAKSSYIYFWSADAGHTIKLKVLIRKQDMVDTNTTVFQWLNNLYGTPGKSVSIDIDTEVVPNDIYYISNFSEYEVIRKDYYECELELDTFRDVRSKLTNICTILQTKLKQCKRPSDKVYTAKQIKKKKVKESNCIGLVNKMLYKKGYYKSKKRYKEYHAFWTKTSRKALINFQKKWNKKGLKPKLNKKGKIDNKTWKAILRYTEL
jgi:hypothetical protein